jgi:hypothetical protein
MAVKQLKSNFAASLNDKKTTRDDTKSIGGIGIQQSTQTHSLLKI